MQIVNEISPLNLKTSAVLEVMNQFTPRHKVDTMACLLNEDLADMHIAYGTANGNASLYQECFPSRDICLNIACLQTYIAGYENMKVSKRKGEVLLAQGIT